MSYTLSGFTASMPEPSYYLHQILGFIPNTIDRLVRWLNEPIVIVMVILVLILGFLFAILE